MSSARTPALHLGPDGAVVPDPWQLLGLPPGTLDERVIRDAWREKLLRHPPEQHPEQARLLREARDLLLDPELAVQRELGVLQAPDPEAWGLPTPGRSRQRVDLHARLLGQLVLFALMERALMEEGEGPAPPERP